MLIFLKVIFIFLKVLLSLHILFSCLTPYLQYFSLNKMHKLCKNTSCNIDLSQAWRIFDFSALVINRFTHYIWIICQTYAVYDLCSWEIYMDNKWIPQIYSIGWIIYIRLKSIYTQKDLAVVQLKMIVL